MIGSDNVSHVQTVDDPPSIEETVLPTAPVEVVLPLALEFLGAEHLAVEVSVALQSFVLSRESQRAKGRARNSTRAGSVSRLSMLTCICRASPGTRTAMRAGRSGG